MLMTSNATVAFALRIIRSNIAGNEPWRTRHRGGTRPVSMIVMRRMEYLESDCSTVTRMASSPKLNGRRPARRFNATS
jgi:hypothetical protein